MTVRLFVSDVDGTLVQPDKSIAPSTAQAVRLLQAAGIQVALVSARPPRGLQPIAAALGLTGPLAGFNGGAVVGIDGQVVSQKLLPRNVARTAIDLFRNRGVWCWLFTADEWLCQDAAGPYVELERRTVRFDERVVDDYEPYLDRIGKLTGVTDDLPLLASLEGELSVLLGAGAAVHLSQRYYLDITHPDAHKGNAVRALAAAAAVDLADVAVIGDMGNDVPMFSVAGLSFAMGNATPDVQSLARYVTGRNDADGWAQAADRLLGLAEEPA